VCERDIRNHLYYLAVPPAGFKPISEALASVGLLHESKGGWRRLVVEKPFGTDLASARALNRDLLNLVDEHQIYRIDHYLGKETVQNILVLRFANGMFEPIWNRNHIDHVQITVAETLDVGRRGNFYEATGALRDMVPNHLFQLLSLVAMEPPSRFDAHSVRSEKAEVLAAIQGQTEQEALRNSVAASIVPDASANARSGTIVQRRMSRRTAIPKPTLRLSSPSIIGDGLGCRSIFAPQGVEGQADRDRNPVQARSIFDVSGNRDRPLLAK